jgi:hypothetical protein
MHITGSRSYCDAHKYTALQNMLDSNVHKAGWFLRNGLWFFP